jgi:type IX secretion system PorP/SprF family membrane protein
MKIAFCGPFNTSERCVSIISFWSKGAGIGKTTLQLLTFIFIFAPFTIASAQDDPQFSQYMYNRLPSNPGYAGSSGGICATALYRNQWVGFDGAPVSANFAIDGLSAAVHGGLGLSVFSDVIGPNQTLGAKVAYAYRTRLFRNGRLALGLDAGLVQKSIDGTMFNTSGTYDPSIPSNKISARSPDFGFGVYYNNEDMYLGASVSHLFEPSFKFDNTTPLQLRRHFFIMGGFNYSLSRNLTLKPSFLIKSDVASSQVDINATLLYNNIIWAGVSYRVEDAVVLMAGVNVTNELRIGYSYDITTSAIRAYSAGSHEIMLRYCFKISAKKPSYMNRNVRFL